MRIAGHPVALRLCSVALLVCAGWPASAPAQQQSLPPSDRHAPFALAVGVCLAALEDVTGVPSWQFPFLRRGEAIRACHDDPLNTVSKVKPVGSLFLDNSLMRRSRTPSVNDGK